MSKTRRVRTAKKRASKAKLRKAGITLDQALKMSVAELARKLSGKK